MAAKGFVRFSDDSFLVSFSEGESEVLINLTGQLIEILAERIDEAHSDPLALMVGITAHDSPPDDEVLLRLLPDAYPDPVDSAEFRRYTESDLRALKRANAMTVRTHVIEHAKSPIILDAEGAQSWLGTLNDVRLALGVRLNVDENSHEQLAAISAEEPMQAVFAVYSWLGWLQESLVLCLMEDLAEVSEE